MPISHMGIIGPQNKHWLSKTGTDLSHIVSWKTAIYVLTNLRTFNQKQTWKMNSSQSKELNQWKHLSLLLIFFLLFPSFLFLFSCASLWTGFFVWLFFWGGKLFFSFSGSFLSNSNLSIKKQTLNSHTGVSRDLSYLS